MSGCAGGNRILREDVEKVVRHYTHYVLKKYKFFQTAVVTGSYNCSDKPDFGDIDLIIHLTAPGYKPHVKKSFADFVNTMPDFDIVPFKSEKYKGKKYLNTGEIISVLYHNPWRDGEFVQIDNIIACSPEEMEFKNKFLSIPAIKQGLMLGLIKCAILEDSSMLPENLPNISKIVSKNQEFEYNLSSSGLTLRLVTLDENYKTIDKYDIYTTLYWPLVETMLNNYDFSEPFEEILVQIKKTNKHPRSINRIKGIFKSMVSVKSGEVGTPKGNEKEYALKLIEKL